MLEWREKCAASTITKEEYAQVVEVLRAGRKAAAELAAIKRAAKKGGKRKKPTTDLLLGESDDERTKPVSASDRQQHDGNLPLL